MGANNSIMNVVVARRPHMVKDRITKQMRQHRAGNQLVYVYETVAIDKKEYNTRLHEGTLEDHLEKLHFEKYGRQLVD